MTTNTKICCMTSNMDIFPIPSLLLSLVTLGTETHKTHPTSLKYMLQHSYLLPVAFSPVQYNQYKYLYNYAHL